MSPTPCYELKDVSHEYRGATSLAGVDLLIEAGEHVAIAGANGSGKSTLLKMLDGLVFPSEGTLEFFGHAVTDGTLEDPEFRRDFRSRVGFVFQDSDVQLFCNTVFDELAFGPLQLGFAEADIRERVASVAEQLRVDALLDRAPYTLSGGEKKRVAIASVLTLDPDVLLLDEPTNALDPRSQVWLLDALDAWKRAGKTVVIATHDLSIAAEEVDRMVVLSEEHVVRADGTPEDVLAQRDLLLEVNLIHEHAHRHESGAHRHPHVHGHLHAHS